jgi:hypothetical protein
MKILIKERQYKALSQILNESIPGIVNALRNLRQLSPNSYDDLARRLDVLVNPTNPVITRQGSSYILNNGQDVLNAYKGGLLPLDEAEKVITYIFKNSTDNEVIESVAKHLVDSDTDFLAKFRNGTLNFDNLSQTYGVRQSQALAKAIKTINPISSKYKSIFGDINTNEALTIIDDAIIDAGNKNIDVILKGKDGDRKEAIYTNADEILTALIDGNITDLVKLKVYIINSIQPGPLQNRAKSYVKDKIVNSFTTAENLRGLDKKSVKEIDDTLRKNIGITNPAVSQAMWKKINPLQGAGTGFKQGITSQGPFDYLVYNRLKAKNLIGTNPLFEKISGDDLIKLLVWAFTGVGDYQKLKSIYKVYGWPATMWNAGGQYLKAYIISATTVYTLKALANWFSTAATNKEVFPDEVTAIQNFFSKENLFENTLMVGIASRILWELGQWMYRVAPGGKLPVFVYQIQDKLKQMIQREEQNLDTLKRQLPDKEDTSTSTEKKADTTSPPSEKKKSPGLPG